MKQELLTNEEFRQLMQEMVEAGVLKVSGHKLEDGQSVPTYATVPHEEWPAEGRALMGGEDAIKFARELYRRSTG